MDEIVVDTSSFNKFARDLRKVDRTLASRLGKELKQAGEIVAVQARANASWSSRIPKSIKVQRRGAVIRIVAKAEDARVFEHRGVPGTFRHPVFGHRDRWVAQGARPFLRPALMQHRKAALESAKRALHGAFRDAGLKF
jgi:hypothetical protein